jgi:dTDP-4-dehydrorhamnose reductase
MKVAVVGASGQLGQDLMRAFGDDAVGFKHEDVDVTDGVGLASVLESARPDWVVNTAAFHRVDDCERNHALAFAVNAVGAGNVARAAAQIGAAVAFISTDYVYGGHERKCNEPYCETDPPEPINVYGVSKWAGERLVMQGNPRHLVIRTTGLYGTATSRKGWTFPELMLSKARSDGAVRVVNDQVLAPTYTSDLAAAMKKLLALDAIGLFHVTNSGECSWFEFAREVFSQTGVSCRMEPIATHQSGRAARRPSYSALTSSRLPEVGIGLLRPWRDALRDYLRAKNFLS